MENDIVRHLSTKLSSYPEWKHHATLLDWQSDFYRFYNSETNYNITKRNLSLDVTLYKGKRSFSFSIDDPAPAKIDRSLACALAIIDSLPEDPDFVDLETDQTVKPAKPKPNNVELLNLDSKISILNEISRVADKHGFDLFGTFICNYQHTRLINSNGLDKEQWASPIYFEVKAVRRSNQVTVLQTFGGERFDRFDLHDWMAELEHKLILAGLEVVDVEPGEYEVILAPRCAAEFLQYLSHGMSAHSYDQKNSYFQNSLGQQVFPPNITIRDDPEDEDIISFDYNDDGHVYRPLTLVDQGVFQNFLCGNYYAYKTGLRKNGNTGSCLVLQSGDADMDSMIRSVRKGLYISSLHYMNFINPKETTVTGLTRDGTFLIEDGVITKVVNNLRYTEKIARIFESITALERQGQTTPFSGNYEFFDITSSKTPHVLVSKFNITSSTRTI